MKKGRSLVIHLLVLTILLVSNCTVEKRRYTKGFYFCRKGNTTIPSSHVQKNDRTGNRENNRITFVGYPAITDKEPGTSPSVYATASTMDVPFVPSKIRPINADSCADVLTFMDGNELLVKIEEVTPEYVAYRRCDYLTGPLIKKVTAEIFRIKYGNGIVHLLKHANGPVNSQQPDISGSPEITQKANGWAVTSFVTSLFSFLLIPAFAAVISGIVALVKIDKNPGKYKNKWMAITGLIIGLLALIIFLLIIFA